MTQQQWPDYIARSEYEQFVKLYEIRHSELRLENKDLESEIKAQLSAVNTKIDTLTSQVVSKGNDGWKLLATSMLSLVSGYLLYYLQHVFIH